MEYDNILISNLTECISDIRLSGSYSVEREMGLNNVPEGAIRATGNPTFPDGTYNTEQLVAYFPQLPNVAGPNNVKVYYKVVVNGDNTTYTIWTVVLNSETVCLEMSGDNLNKQNLYSLNTGSVVAICAYDYSNNDFVKIGNKQFLQATLVSSPELTSREIEVYLSNSMMT